MLLAREVHHSFQERVRSVRAILPRSQFPRPVADPPRSPPPATPRL